MKKAKVMLTVVALVAVIAGVFAFKARLGDTIYVYNTADSKCDQALTQASTDPDLGGVTVSGTFVNTTAATAIGACTLTNVYYTAITTE